MTNAPARSVRAHAEAQGRAEQILAAAARPLREQSCAAAGADARARVGAAVQGRLWGAVAATASPRR